MKELTLFDIELECEVDKFSGYVAADNAHEAEEMAKNRMLTNFEKWWEEEGRIYEMAELGKAVDGPRTSEAAFGKIEEVFESKIKELKNMRLTMLKELGKVLV